MRNKISAIYLKFRESTFYKHIWIDNVWSKVISAGIIAILGTLFTAIFLILKSIILNVPFTNLFKSFIAYLKAKSEISNSLIIICIIIILVSLLFFLKLILLKVKKSKSIKSDLKAEQHSIGEHSTAFFSSILARAFPGQRGFKWYDDKDAVSRLKILLREPLRFRSIVADSPGDPIWWFRGQRAMFIDNFKTLSKTKVLIGIEEIEIEKIGVHISDSYYKSFVYVVAKGEKPSGLYETSTEDVELYKELWGFYNEEYGVLGKKLITRNEYDDGAAIINEKVVDASDAELRVRYLTSYNFIIAAKQSPFNSKKFSKESDKVFNDLLLNKIDFKIFLNYMNTFEKNE